jgi:hypothetical protein
MQVEDIELKEPSLKRQLTPPTDVDSQPPAKRSVPEEEGEEEVTMIEEASDNGEEEAVNGEAGDNKSGTGEAGDGATGEAGDDNDGAAGEAGNGATGEDGEAGEAEQPASVEMTETGELLPNNLPKIYDLFATCVSVFSCCTVRDNIS